MDEMDQEIVVFKQEREDESVLYPFVCGICGYRFNRINAFCQHFEMHSDMVTSEFFHSCQSEENGLDGPVDKYDMSACYYSCAVCSQQFATLCLLHDHLCQRFDNALYIVDTEKRKGIPRGRKCVGSIYTGAMSLPEDGEIFKKEAQVGTEEDGDEEIEYEGFSMEESERGDLENEDGTSSFSVSEQNTPEIMKGKLAAKRSKEKGDSGIAIQKITVNYGDHSETYDVNVKESEKDEGKKRPNCRDVGITATESEADEDMSDMELDQDQYSYLSSGSESIKKKYRIKRQFPKTPEDAMFDSYERSEDLKSRRRDSIPVPASEVKGMMAKAKLVDDEEGPTARVYCPACNKVVLKSYLLQHFRKTHSDQEFPCDMCGKIFSNKGYLKDHIRFYHEGIRKVRPTDKAQTVKQGRNFSAESMALLEKAKIVGEEDGSNTKVACPVCDKVLLRHYLVKHHQKIHSNKEYPCDQCDKVFHYNGYLADHKRYVHQGKKKKSMLTRYAKEPKVIALCDSAQPVERQAGEKPKVKCPKCDKTIQQEYLAKHIRSAHSDQEYPCNICGKVYSCKRFLYEHQKYVHMEKDTECDVCHKMFKGLAAMQKHKRMIHTDKKPYSCNLCPGRFRTNVDLKRHLSQHEDASIYCYQCPKCERRFKTSKTLNGHERAVHRRAGRLQCKWPGCNRILNDRATFKKHYCIHTGERPNKCPLCDRAFIQRVALRYHLKTKHNSEDKMPPGKLPIMEQKREIKIEEQAEPAPLYLEDQVEAVESEYTEIPVGTVLEGSQVAISDSSIVSDLIEIAQSSEGGVVPEALQHVFDGENRTIVIYYQ